MDNSRVVRSIPFKAASALLQSKINHDGGAKFSNNFSNGYGLTLSLLQSTKLSDPFEISGRP